MKIAEKDICTPGQSKYSVESVEKDDLSAACILDRYKIQIYPKLSGNYLIAMIFPSNVSNRFPQFINYSIFTFWRTLSSPTISVCKVDVGGPKILWTKVKVTSTGNSGWVRVSYRFDLLVMQKSSAMFAIYQNKVIFACSPRFARPPASVHLPSLWCFCWIFGCLGEWVLTEILYLTRWQLNRIQLISRV